MQHTDWRIVGLLAALSVLFALALLALIWGAASWSGAGWPDAALVVQVVGTLTAVFGGGGFALYRLRVFRTFQPHLTVTHEVSHRPVGRSYVHIAVTANLRNSSRVAIELRQGLVALLKVSPVSDAEVVKLYKQRFVTGETEEIEWEALDVIRRNWDAQSLIVEPGETHPETYEFIVAGSVETVLVNTFFTNSPLPVENSQSKGWTAVTVYDTLRYRGSTSQYQEGRYADV